jgi:VacB/RNase II family 3'-5' exoribonuclease
MDANDRHDRQTLQDIARRVMLERGLLPDFSAAVLAELDKIQAPANAAPQSLRDLRELLWCSIDNDDSLDLDQLTVAQAMPGGDVKTLVAVADVDGLVKDGTAIEDHARQNATSVHTAARTFSMLPEKLSTGLTSLNLNEDRQSIVIEMMIAADGSLQSYDVYGALVRNHAKLAYDSVSGWLEGTGAEPEGISAVPGLAENLHLQDVTAQAMKNLRHVHGALSLETVEAQPIFDGDAITALKAERKNRATDIIEDLMITANGATAQFLVAKGSPSIRRVVRAPERWDRIVEIAAEHGFTLPAAPDAKALEDFLTQQKATDPLRFPDLSLSVIKLLGAGEYVAELPDNAGAGHFGLAVKDYTHSTAPNRRYSDLITQRLLKAVLRGDPSPYSADELVVLATHCTHQENVADKVERQVAKSAAALFLESRIGEQFAAVVTGASPKGTWVRLLDVPVEGKLAEGFDGLDVGDSIHVELISVDIQQGYIDFAKAGPAGAG